MKTEWTHASEPTDSGTYVPPRGATEGPGERLLTAEEEASLAHRIQQYGCVTSRNTLVERNLGLVKSLARKFAGSSNQSFDDLVANGSLALIRAAERFDPARGVRFGSYAAPWITHTMRAARSESGIPVRLPARVLRKLYSLARARDALTSQLGRTPTATELAVQMGLSPSYVRDLRDHLSLLSSTRAFDGSSLLENIAASLNSTDADESESSPHGEVSLTGLQAVIDDLPASERAAVVRIFGIERHAPQSVKQAAAELSTNATSVKRALHRGLARIKARLGDRRDRSLIPHESR